MLVAWLSTALASTNSSAALATPKQEPTLGSAPSPRAPPRLLLPPRPLAPYDPPAVPDVAPHLIHPLRYAESTIVMLAMFAWYLVAMIMTMTYSA